MKEKTRMPHTLFRKTYISLVVITIVLASATYTTGNKTVFSIGLLLWTFFVSAFHFASIAPLIKLKPFPRFFWPSSVHEALSLVAYLCVAILHAGLYTALLFPNW